MPLSNKLNSILLSSLFVSIILLSICSYTKQDIPVHCVIDDIHGIWGFKISNNQFSPSLLNQDTTCGHGLPDTVDNSSKKDTEIHFQSAREILVELTKDFEIKDTKTGDNIGHFTMVYDEGMLLNIKNQEIFVYFKYYKEGGIFKSDCSKTMKGWYVPDKYMKDSNWSCCFGYKSKVLTHSTVKHTNINLNSNGDSFFDNTNFLQTSTTTKTVLKTKLKTTTNNNNNNNNNNNDLLINQKYNNMNHIINEINNSKSSLWTAGYNDYFKDLNLSQVNQRIGNTRKTNKSHTKNLLNHIGNLYNKNKSLLIANKNLKQSYIQLKSTNQVGIKEDSFSSSLSDSEIEPTSGREKDSKDVNDYNETSKYLHTPIEEMDATLLPKNWDWRNVGGQSYVPEPRLQGDCGSCYVFASLSSLESRLRIKSNNDDKTEFSRQWILSCGIYTEGCNGGYPILVGKFAHEFELIPETCMPYKEETGNCSNHCDINSLSRKYTVSTYGYIGGAYGKTTEEDMIKELRARGPILGNLAVPYTFSYYKKGIFNHDHSLKANAGDLNETSNFENNIPWQKVDHSTLIIGYGEENGVKYWICMNTWGKDWGENGYYRILRGVDESFIESMGDVLDIQVNDR